jgi:hypothetical protein
MQAIYVGCFRGKEIRFEAPIGMPGLRFARAIRRPLVAAHYPRHDGAGLPTLREFRPAGEGISTNILADRLHNLVAAAL